MLVVVCVLVAVAVVGGAFALTRHWLADDSDQGDTRSVRYSAGADRERESERQRERGTEQEVEGDEDRATEDEGTGGASESMTAMGATVGSWKGSVVQSDDQGESAFDMQLDVYAGGVLGTTTYYLGDDVCVGSIVRVEESAESVEYEEKIQSGPCVGTGMVTLWPMGDELAFSYVTTKANGMTQWVEGDLVRMS